MSKTTTNQGMLITVRKTDSTARNEFDPTPLPVYEGDRVPYDDCRVRLEDGTVCHVHHNDFNPTEPYPILCTELVALDSGDNVIRRRIAADGSSAGLAAPAHPHTSIVLRLVPANGTIVGYYRYKA